MRSILPAFLAVAQLCGYLSSSSPAYFSSPDLVRPTYTIHQAWHLPQAALPHHRGPLSHPDLAQTPVSSKLTVPVLASASLQGYSQLRLLRWVLANLPRAYGSRSTGAHRLITSKPRAYGSRSTGVPTPVWQASRGPLARDQPTCTHAKP